ncbi:MAG: AAA family ATPase [Gemmatimonadota bacterium]|nr:AAA family ATPase [Gemmatimonadota bacterium]MDE2870081.1 AAA family ATPase [Gemmatimonadota bacterium]
MRQGGHYYVDKTPHIERLIESGSTYFLSRPRRFGKSLLVDTLKELFEGSEDLFRGLAIHPRWDWSVRHPVLKLDFAGGSFSTTERLESEVVAQLSEAALRTGVAEAVQYPGDVGVSAPTRLRRVIEAMRERCGQRVVGLRARAPGARPRRDPGVVQRLPLAGRARLQPLRRSVDAAAPGVRTPLVRDGHADVPAGPSRP